jgi:formylglycine-generating enzyme required for sulfatase activity
MSLQTHNYVTEKEFEEFCKATNSEARPAVHPTWPVVRVSWNEAAEYCKWAKGRLPTDKELEGQICFLWEWTDCKNIWGASFGRVAYGLRTADRDWVGPGGRSDDLGFRCIGGQGYGNARFI